MAGGGDNRGGTGALELGLMNALRTGNRNVDLFVVAFLPTLIALVATSSERLRDVIRSAAGTGLRRKKRFERIVRVERRPTRWGRGSKIEPEAKNEVLQKAIAWHLVRCGALDGADDAKLRLLARGASEKGAGRHRWNKSFGTTSALLKQYDVVSAVPDDVWVSVPGAPGDLKVMRAVDDGQEDKEEGKDNSTTSIDFRLACDELSPIEAQVLSLRYGLEDGAALSWKQIAHRCEMPEKQLQLAQSRALRKLRKQRALRQLQPFCDHEDWENDPLGKMSPGERLGAR